MPAVVVVNQPSVTLFSGSTQVAVSGSPLRIDPTGQTHQPVSTPGQVSVGNSSTSNLGSYGAFTGSWEEVVNFAGLTVSVFADRDSASDGLSFQWSGDGVNKDRVEDSGILSGSGRAFNISTRARYFRVVYANGATGQTSFRLSTVYHANAPGIVTRPIDSSISADNFVQLVKSVITGQDSTGSFINVSVDGSGRLSVNQPSSTATRKGFSDGKIVLGSTSVTAVYATTYTEQLTNAQRSISSANANDTSAAGTGARTVSLTYYDQNLNGPYTETLVLTGTTAVNTSGSNICFIERMEVETVGSNGSNVGIISLYAATGALGATVWSIAASDNRTFGSHHYISSGSTAYITGFLLGIKGADTTSGFLKVKNPMSGANSAEVQVSDTLRAPSSGQGARTYGSPVQVSSPAKITGYVQGDSTSSRTYFISFDYYEE